MKMLFSTSILSMIGLTLTGTASSYELSSDNTPQHDPDQCTAILVTAGAAKDGVGSMTTHTNDCLDCDFRLVKVPAADHAPGSMRPIIGGRAQYPRYVGDDRGEPYSKEALAKGLYDWKETVAVGHIPEVPHTYAYLDGDYGIQNEFQLSMGESTCGALLHSRPTFDGGRALLEMSELSRIAMERCKTSRCAVQLMGDLAVEYGFYGAVWEGDMMTVLGEAGEAMTVTDKEESWMFHVLSDDTGASAVWVAQRVPEGHVTAVANGFVIKEVDLSDADNFLGSDNLYSVASRAGLWTEGEHFSFAEVYGLARGHLSTYVNRRVWRVLSLAAPSLNLPAETDMWARDYPFSVPVDDGLAVADVAAMQRDYYEGTPYDTSGNPAGGPYGNPARYDQSPVDGMTKEDLVAGRFERTISLFRTSYSFVTQSRASLPDVVGGLTWFGQFTPHATVYVPVYASVLETPESLSVGSLHRLDRRSCWWAFSAVGNYAAQWFSFTIGEIRAMQGKLEEGWFQGQEEVEALALTIQGYGGDVAARGYLTEWSAAQAEMVRAEWWEFLDYMMGKYRDGMKMADVKVDMIKPTKLFYPRWWLEMTGFWGAPGATASEAKKNNEGEFEYDVEWDKKPKHKKSAASFNSDEVSVHSGSTFDGPTPKVDAGEDDVAGASSAAVAKAASDVMGATTTATSPVLGAGEQGPRGGGGHGTVTLAVVAAVGAALGAGGKKYVDSRKGTYTTIPI